MPESGKLTSQEFSSALSRTIDAMQREATKASVALPPKDASGQTYSFSFAAQRERLAYAPGSLEPLSVQLGEIKAICAVLFQAKINSLDNLRRERVSEDDLKGPQTDYLPEKSVTNELAVLSPYEVSFRCFSSELAAVLAGFASSPCGLLVKTINVESAPAVAAPDAIRCAGAYTASAPRLTCLRRRRPGWRRRMPRLLCRALRAGAPAGRHGPRPPMPLPGRYTPAGGADGCAGQPGRPAAGAGREAIESHLDAQCGETASLPSKMDFLKKHYEKVLLGVVLLGLAVAVAFLPFKIASEKQKLEDMRNSSSIPRSSR